MSSPNNQDTELAEFFTDVVHLRDAFKNAVAAPTLAKRLLVIHGVGGVGKSSLLRMFRLHCKSVNVPVALASGDEAKSALDILARWTDDLKADNIALPSFSKTFEHYRAIQAKVDEQAKKAQDARGRAADIAGKAASKTAEAAGGALAGAAIGSVIPGIGTAIGGALGGVLGGMGAEALVDWMRGFLTKPDIDLLLDPAKKLTDDFLVDVAQAADKRRIVLMLDTFEQMTALDDWARDVAQRLPANVLFVIAGRALPNWSRAWNGFMANAQVEELKPMTEEVMRELIQRYYATMRGGQPNPTQVDAIIRFARGLPMVVTSAVQLWVKYGVEDFQSVKAEIVANLVDRLIEGVPSTLIPALEAAAVVRWFDQPILRAVMKQDDVRDIYNELRRFPFVRTRVEGLALHDAVREIMDENLRAQDSERHCELHERAAAYFEKRLEKATGEEAERLGLERLYHHVCADEEAGVKLFQEMAEELARYRLVNRLRALLNDVNTYPLERENSRLWWEYYNARSTYLEGKLEDALERYRRLNESEPIDSKLRAYVMADYGDILRAFKKDELAVPLLEKSTSLIPLDAKLAESFHHLAGAYRRLRRFSDAWKTVERMKDYYIQVGDRYGLSIALDRLEVFYIDNGDFHRANEIRKQRIEVLASLRPALPYLEIYVRGGLGFARSLSGRYFEIEIELKEALQIARRLEATNAVYIARDLGYVLGMEGKYSEAEFYFEDSSLISERFGPYMAKAEQAILDGFWGAVLKRRGMLNEAEEKLIRSLKLKTEINDLIGIPELNMWLGELAEVDWVLNQAIPDRLLSAESYDNECASQARTLQSRYYFFCAALTGLVRVKHAQGDYAAIPPLLAETEQLAQQYEYNDHLASLRLTQGMTTDKIGLNGQTNTLDYFKQAMIYALRYNRFLLDEVLSGRPQGTPLRPIIPYCLERGEEGQRMLIALRDWWKTGVNDIGTPRPDTISPIPEGIALLEAERIAREREPGDGSPQKIVIEQIESALAAH